MTDALGNLVRFVLIPGQHYDTVGVAPLIKPADFQGLIADKAFDVHWIADALKQQGAKIVISQRKNRLRPRPFDAGIFKWRHLIENFFAKLKEFKRIAMRSDKTDHSFEAMIYLAAAVINSR
jgi:transposase